ncbi:MAG: hypothetical protein ACK4NR_02740 [Micavibrio sp.]
MKEEFEDASKPEIDVDAVDYIMNNVFDWDAHKEHAGLRMGFHDCKVLSQSLRQNLKSSCPSVRDDQAFDYYEDLIHNNWAGDFQQIQELTSDVIRAFIEADMGEPGSLGRVKKAMKNRINYMETHYSEVRHSEELPMHVTAALMEKRDDDSRRNTIDRVNNITEKARGVMDMASAAENSVMRRKFPVLYKWAKGFGL